MQNSRSLSPNFNTQVLLAILHIFLIVLFKKFYYRSSSQQVFLISDCLAPHLLTQFFMGVAWKCDIFAYVAWSRFGNANNRGGTLSDVLQFPLRFAIICALSLSVSNPLVKHVLPVNLYSAEINFPRQNWLSWPQLQFTMQILKKRSSDFSLTDCCYYIITKWTNFDFFNEFPNNFAQLLIKMKKIVFNW